MNRRDFLKTTGRAGLLAGTFSLTDGLVIPGQEAHAVERMAELFAEPEQALATTGTEDCAVGVQRCAQQSDRETVRGGATQSEPAGGREQGAASPKPLRVADLGDVVRSDATESESRARGTRTPNQRIMSPLL